MNMKEEDLLKITKLISTQIEYVTCVECCKLYIAPETAPCGHTLCHMCWRERLTCPCCAKPIDRSTLKLNRSMQKLKENVLTMVEAYEKLFNIKVAEVLLDLDFEGDPTKNVQDWLTSSQNHFSAPPHSEKSQEKIEFPKPLNVSSNKIQIHAAGKTKNPAPEKVVYVPTVPQDDWDKIEPLPDTEEVGKKGKENVIGPMDIEPFCADDENQYTADNPRRSSRKRDLKPTNENLTNNNKELVKQNSMESNEETSQKANTAKQNWNNVKRMRKEFSKLNKKNRNKLNVSIEMCKKTPSTAKTLEALPQQPSAYYDIDENTPNDNLLTKEVPETRNINVDEGEITEPIQKSNTNNSTIIEKQNQSSLLKSKQAPSTHDEPNPKNEVSLESNIHQVHSTKGETSNTQPNQTNTSKIPFYKKSTLNPSNSMIPTEGNIMNTMNQIVESNTKSNDDIEITIKVGNTVANVLIKRQANMELKLNTDREIQTSLGTHKMYDNASIPQSAQTEKIVINLGEDNNINDMKVVQQTTVGELKEDGESNTVASIKKNTDSADTATAQYEITASVEKELSKQMEVEFTEPEKTKTIPTEKSTKSNLTENTSNKQSQRNQKTVEIKKIDNTSAPSQKAPSNIDVDEYINDIDIFESEPIKEQQVHYLKHTEPAPSEILVSTAKLRSRTQKSCEKRCRGGEDDILPTPKKAKCGETNRTKITAEKNESEAEPDSEPITYDAIMGAVFANIDADIGESQNIIKNTYSAEDKISQNKRAKKPTHIEMTPGVELPTDDNGPTLRKVNTKDSEILFTNSAGRDDSEVTVPLASLAEKVPHEVASSIAGEFLTPVMCEPLDEDVEMASNASDDKSIVEETPQKTSFTKVKKSNGANRGNKNVTQTQEEEVPIQKQPSKPETEDMNSIVSITDTSIRSTANETAIRKPPSETPLTIDKFVNQIQHKSTPFAKKSLNFDTQNDDVTICATSEGVVNTTQEREFMLKAFEKTPTTVVKPTVRSLALKHKKYVIAGSSLSSREIEILKRLCAKNNWSYVTQYTSELTHLVVKADEENKGQRTIKYMCALAASKWIISYEWVAKCMQSKEPVNEEDFEVLDSTGYPGPMKSRLATRKLFEGIKFFCKEPFTVLGLNILQEIITSSGGTVVDSMKAVRVLGECSPALLLAEPEHTEDQFTYIAMEQNIVPVNYEWVLNCLGSYTLHSILELLLCSAALLPKPTQHWPRELLAAEGDVDDDE